MGGLTTGIKIFASFILLTCTFNLEAQDLHCNKSNIHLNVNDLIVAIDDYKNNEKQNNTLILVDYQNEDSISHFRILSSMEGFDIFYKKPDCYLQYDKSIAYIHTKAYESEKDTIWLKCLFDLTRESLNYPKVNVLWKKDSIVNIEGYATSSFTSFSPPIIEYIIKKGQIFKKEIVANMLYPHTGYPKGIKNPVGPNL